MSSQTYSFPALPLPNVSQARPIDGYSGLDISPLVPIPNPDLL
jgi:hypothetical protein